MLSEHRADELKRKSKDELIALLLEAERQRNAAQHGLDMLHSREPGRYAFYCRHLALAYVRKQAPDLYSAAFSKACRAIDEQGGKSYQDVVAGLEAMHQAIADLAGGWDEHGALGPREPLSWETVARMAMDYARAALKGIHGDAE